MILYPLAQYRVFQAREQSCILMGLAIPSKTLKREAAHTDPHWWEMLPYLARDENLLETVL